MKEEIRNIIEQEEMVNYEKRMGDKWTTGLSMCLSEKRNIWKMSKNNYFVQLIEHPILRILNFLFIYFLSIFSR